MNTNTIIGIIVIAVIIIIGGYFLFTADSTDVETGTDDTGVVSETPAPDGLDEGVEETQISGGQGTLGGDSNAEGANDIDNDTTPPLVSDSWGNIVTYTNSGFSPSTITIAKGETVTWTNESNGSMWVASAFHPTHTVYPGSDIKKCGTAQATGIFDACAGIASGQSWSFTFNSAGEWGYHNHLDVSRFGKVIVQ